MVDKLWALILPNALSPFYTLIMIKFFKNIPESLIESAKMDGYNDISVLFKIVLPLSPAVLATVGLFYAVWRWNEYLPGIMYITSSDKRVLQVILRSMLYTEEMAGQVGDQFSLVTPQHMKMATIIITMLPIMVVYPFLQKYFMHGVMLGAVKQ
jgi:ABC-type glycerol-3-phosphate transport system permease component